MGQGVPVVVSDGQEAPMLSGDGTLDSYAPPKPTRSRAPFAGLLTIQGQLWRRNRASLTHPRTQKTPAVFWLDESKKLDRGRNPQRG
jgi:hypothetical protein